MKTKQQGFTLIEIAIVIAIIGIVSAGLLTGMGAMRETAKFKEDQRKLQDVKSALLSYAAVNGNLPCPDTNNDGQENRTAGKCDATHGELPHLTLQTHARNAYGLAFSYHVNREIPNKNTTDRFESANYFASANCDSLTPNGTNPPCFVMKTHPVAVNDTSDTTGYHQTGSGNFDIKTDNTNIIAASVPLVVISHGQNGCNNVSGFEGDNCDTTATEYFQAQQGKDFDDVIIWLTSLEIKKITPGILDNIDQSSNNNNNNQSEQLTFIPIIPGDDVESISFDQTIQGDEGFSSGGNTNDTVKVDGNLTASISLGNGTDILYIMGDVNATITSGNQSKTIYIDGDQNSAITLGGGNAEHNIHITGHSNANITTGTSSKTDLIIEKNLTANVNLGGSGNAAFIGGDIIGTIYGNGIIYINKVYNQITTTEFNRISGGFSTTGNAKCRTSMQTTTWRNCQPS